MAAPGFVFSRRGQFSDRASLIRQRPRAYGFAANSAAVSAFEGSDADIPLKVNF